jgi:high-affinity iron transporter
MGATFLITLREAFEASLLLGLVYTYLHKVGAREHFRWVTTGAGLGLAASVGMGVAVGFLSGPLLDLGPDVIGAAVLFLAVVLLTWHAWWMQQHARGIRNEVQQRIDQARATQRLWLVGLIAFTGVFREGAETVLFLWGIMAQATSPAGWGSVLGGVAGIATAAALGWLIFFGGRNVSLPKFFAITTTLILFLAAGLFSTGIGRLQGLGVLPLSGPVWDTSAILSDQSVVGSFLSGLVGYRAQPSLLEIGAYVGYLLAAGLLLFGGALKGAPPVVTATAAEPSVRTKR